MQHAFEFYAERKQKTNEAPPQADEAAKTPAILAGVGRRPRGAGRLANPAARTR
jgi:hypothetical protein